MNKEFTVEETNLIYHGFNSPQLCCGQNFTEQSEVGAIPRSSAARKFILYI